MFKIFCFEETIKQPHKQVQGSKSNMKKNNGKKWSAKHSKIKSQSLWFQVLVCFTHPHSPQLPFWLGKKVRKSKLCITKAFNKYVNYTTNTKPKTKVWNDKWTKVEIGDVNIGKQSIIKELKVLLQLKLCFLFIQIWKMYHKHQIRNQSAKTTNKQRWRLEMWKLETIT